MQRNEKLPPSHPSQHLSFQYHALCAAGATLFVHPFRVMLNRASYHTSPINTITDSFNYMIRGAGINLVRGTTAASLQAYAKHETQQYYGEEHRKGLIMSLLAAALVGTGIAKFVEIPFMRKTAMQASESYSQKPTLFKFNLPLTMFFFTREIGFSSAVLAAHDMPKTAHYSILLSAAWGTAACHKLAMIEATKEFIPATYSVPNYKDGYLNVLRNLARGIYTHPALKPVFVTPKNPLQLTVNVLNATCGANMFVFRLTYLKAFSEVFGFFKHAAHERQATIAADKSHRHSQ